MQIFKICSVTLYAFALVSFTGSGFIKIKRNLTEKKQFKQKLTDDY